MTKNKEIDMADYVGTFINNNGSKYKIREILVGDILGLDMTSPEFPYRLMALAVNLSFDEFKRWSVTDMMRLSGIINMNLEV